MPLRSGAGSIYRSITAAAARHAGRVCFGPTVRRLNILVVVVVVVVVVVCVTRALCSAAEQQFRQQMKAVNAIALFVDKIGIHDD